MADDRPHPPHIIFLGAGASVEAGVPTTEGFVTEFPKYRRLRDSEHMRRTLLPLYRKVVAALDESSKASKNFPEPVDIESVLDAVGRLLTGGTIVSSAISRPRSEFVGVDPRLLQELLVEIRGYIRYRSYVKPEKTGYLKPYLKLIAEGMPLDIFTVNYDLVIEEFLDRNQQKYVDGFDLYWNPNLFDGEQSRAVDLYKLHGSVNWFSVPAGRAMRLPLRLHTSTVELQTGERAMEVMAYPAQKSTEEQPLSELLRRFEALLVKAYWVVIVGYSFRDEKFVRMFQRAASTNENLRFILIGPSAEEIYRERLEMLPHEAEHGLTGTGLLPSPLAQKVLILPFCHGAVLPDLISTILPAAKEAWRSEQMARTAEMTGDTRQWRDVAKAYLQASFLDRAELFEDRFTLSDQDPTWQLPYLIQKSVVAWSVSRLGTGNQAWSSAMSILQEWMVSRLRLDLTVQPPQIRPSYAITPLPKGGYTAYSPDNLRSLVAPAVSTCNRVLVYVEDPAARKAIERARKELGSITSYLEQFQPTGALDLRVFSKTREKVVGSIASQVASQALALKIPISQEIVEKVVSGLTEVERKYIAKTLFG